VDCARYFGTKTQIKKKGIVMKQNDKDSDRAIMAMPRSRRHNHKTDVKDESRRMEVELTFEAPQAERVFVAGDFNHWRAGDLRLRRDETGTWRIPLWLAPGRYEYRFIVDGEWQNDPQASACVPNEFGSSNCVLVVK
jgi:1,4-alpha-glucan branching enzyme